MRRCTRWLSCFVVGLVALRAGAQDTSPEKEWLKARAPVGENYHDLKRLARSLGLHTVCESAQCPNIGECWHHKKATFMMLGNLCTRRQLRRNLSPLPAREHGSQLATTFHSMVSPPR